MHSHLLRGSSTDVETLVLDALPDAASCVVAAVGDARGYLETPCFSLSKLCFQEALNEITILIHGRKRHENEEEGKWKTRKEMNPTLLHSVLHEVAMESSADCSIPVVTLHIFAAQKGETPLVAQQAGNMNPFSHLFFAPLDQNTSL